jgi:hypothetical protein
MMVVEPWYLKKPGDCFVRQYNRSSPDLLGLSVPDLSRTRDPIKTSTPGKRK